jgi:hypothetical protein
MSFSSEAYEQVQRAQKALVAASDNTTEVDAHLRILRALALVNQAQALVFDAVRFEVIDY